MKKIDSFKIDHTRLKPGLYVSRYDSVGLFGKLTTFDIRFKAPYKDKPLTPAVAHTIEHLATTWLRSSALKNSIVYFGPMGCLTGFYLIMKGKLCVRDVQRPLVSLFLWMSNFRNVIPGATKKECGNYMLNDLEFAKKEAYKYLKEILCSLNRDNTMYPK